MSVDLRCGDSFDLLDTLADNSVDTVILDPPAGISFMGKDWDSDRGGRDAWIAWLSAILAKCLRVAKPGSMMLCWALPRTSHWTGTAIENAGWEVRDVISHLFGSGFPKSLAIDKAIDRTLGAEREVVGERQYAGGHVQRSKAPRFNGQDYAQGSIYSEPSQRMDTAPATPAAREWDGYGTALKPACEFWWLAMKPLEGTFAQNALKWGVAGLNVDAGRIGTDDNRSRPPRTPNAIYGNGHGTNETASESNPQGRFPSHVVLSHSPNCNGSCADDCPVRLLDEQSGQLSQCGGPKKVDSGKTSMFGIGRAGHIYREENRGASRFFYVAKASRRERDAGLEGMPEYEGDFTTCGLNDPNLREQRGRKPIPTKARNHHPTVKPLTLMEYLCNLTRTPTGGIVLDPFMGSGSTIVAAIRTGRSAIGFEAKSEYYEIAVARAKHAQQGQPTLL